MSIDEAIKDNCDGKCTSCSNTELPNIKDCKEIDIGYSYAYKTDCAGDRYIKSDEVKYLLKCEHVKAIDDFVKEICKMIVQSENNGNYRFYAVEIKQAIADLAEQLKEGVKNENNDD